MSRVEKVLDALFLDVKRKRSRRLWLLCPFHDDHSPTNFFVRIGGKREGQNHCFSCKRGGTLTDLVMWVRSCDFEAARAFIELLGKGYEPPRARVRVVSRAAKPSRVRFRMPREVMFEPIEEWVTPARDYAKKERHLTAEEVDRFGLGYAVDGRLSGRIVIPWRGKGGVPHGYSARSFTNEEPKYLTPHESENADLGTMFGEHTWPVLHERKAVVVVEGAFNGLAVSRALYDYRVDIAALGGSDANPIHAIKLTTFPTVLFLTDPDPPGDKVAASLRDMIGRYTQSNRIRLPEGTDADTIPRDVLRRRLVEVLETFGVAPVPFAS